MPPRVTGTPRSTISFQCWLVRPKHAVVGAMPEEDAFGRLPGADLEGRTDIGEAGAGRVEKIDEIDMLGIGAGIGGHERRGLGQSVAVMRVAPQLENAKNEAFFLRRSRRFIGSGSQSKHRRILHPEVSRGSRRMRRGRSAQVAPRVRHSRGAAVKEVLVSDRPGRITLPEQCRAIGRLARRSHMATARPDGQQCSQNFSLKGRASSS